MAFFKSLFKPGPPSQLQQADNEVLIDFVTRSIQHLDHGWGWTTFEVPGQSDHWVQVAMNKENYALNVAWPWDDHYQARFASAGITLPDAFEVVDFNNPTRREAGILLIEVDRRQIEHASAFVCDLLEQLYGLADNKTLVSEFDR